MIIKNKDKEFLKNLMVINMKGISRRDFSMVLVLMSLSLKIVNIKVILLKIKEKVRAY